MANEITNHNPEGVELPSPPITQPLQGWVVDGLSHGFRLALHPWLFKLIPFGDAMEP